MSARSSGCSVSSSERESSGEITEKDGFSVVAATSTTHWFSTPGSSASCWALVKRWISSRNSTVVRPCRSRSVSASSITFRTSLTPAVIAESSTNFRDTPRAITWARVVLPVPGGPHRMIDDGPAGPRSSPASTCSGEPGLSRCCWPTISSRRRGRIRTARGARERERRARPAGRAVRSAWSPVAQGPGSGASRSSKREPVTLSG